MSGAAKKNCKSHFYIPANTTIYTFPKPPQNAHKNRLFLTSNSSNIMNTINPNLDCIYDIAF